MYSSCTGGWNVVYQSIVANLMHMLHLYIYIYIYIYSSIFLLRNCSFCLISAGTVPFLFPLHTIFFIDRSCSTNLYGLCPDKILFYFLFFIFMYLFQNSDLKINLLFGFLSKWTGPTCSNKWVGNSIFVWVAGHQSPH
jgi:hypothetical protein